MRAMFLVVALMLGVQQNTVLESRVYRPAAVSAIRDRGTTDMAELNVRVVTVGPREGMHAARDAHREFEELIIVTAGRLAVRVNGVDRTVGPGSVAMFLPGDEHEMANAGNESVTLYRFQYRARLPMDAARGRRAGGSFVVDWDSVPVLTTPVGFRRNIFDRPTAMFPRFEMHVSTLNGGLTNHAAHTHRPEEFVLMLKGNVRMLIGEMRQEATVGDLIFLASQLPHSLDNIGTGPAEYFAFQGW